MKFRVPNFRYYILKFLFERFALPKTRNEQISKKLLKRYLPGNPVILDCGAYDGKDSIELQKVFKGKVYCCEAVPGIYRRLNKNISGFPDIFGFNIALSDEDGFQNLYVSYGDLDGSSSLMEPKTVLSDHSQIKFHKPIQVETKRLDTWASENQITKIDLLWLDMQGYEMNMLKASNKIFDSVKVIHTEVSTRETYKGVPKYEEYKAFLKEKGFEVIIEAIPKGWDMGNVLFVRMK